MTSLYPEHQQPFTAIVTVTTDSQEHAEQVLSERLLHDEDYGFDYTVNYAELQPESASRGVILDASVVHKELNDLVENAPKSATSSLPSVTTIT